MVEYPFKDLLPLDEVLEREGYYKDWTHLDPKVFYSLTQISEYIKTKGFGVDVRLLIAQLAEHFSLKTAQINQIELFFKDVMQELAEDKDYYSLPEIAGARGGFETLSQHINEKLYKNRGAVTSADLSQEVKESMTGGSVAVVGQNSVLEENIVDGQVTPDKTNFIKTIEKVNLFNKDDLQRNGYFSPSSGEWIPDDAYDCSAYISIEPGKSYKRNGIVGKNMIFFDSDKVFVASSVSGEINVAVDSRARYAVLTIYKGEADTIMFTEKDKFPSQYVPYIDTHYELEDYKLRPNDIMLDNYITAEHLMDNSVTPDKTNFIKTIEKVNLFNKDDLQKNGYFSPTTGEWLSSDNHDSSTYIPIEPGKSYKRNGIVGKNMIFFDSDKVFVASSVSGEINVAVDSRARYAVLTIYKGEADTIMFTEKDKFPSQYVPYIDAEYEFDDSIRVNTTSSDTHTYDTKPIELYLPDFSGSDEPWHPSVIYIKGGFAGYKYWLAQSVYPNNPNLNEQKDRYEVPIVYKSNDGINWIVAANPLDDLTESEITNKSYMSDPHVVYNDDFKQLEVWYRLTHVVGSTLPTTIFRKVTSDGQNWSEREVTVPEALHTAADFARSPSIIYDAGIYKMWKTNNSGIYYQQASDAKTWTAQVLVDAGKASTGAVGDRWHIDVAKYQADEGLYHLVVYNMSADTIEYFSSADGLAFNFKRTILKTGTGTSDLHNTRLYKSASVMDEHGNIRLYFSGTGTRHVFEGGAYKANVGLYVAPAWIRMESMTHSEKEKIDKDLLMLQASALGVEITKLNYKIDSHSRI